MRRILPLVSLIVALYATSAGAVPPPCPANVTPTPTSCWSYNEVSGTTAFDAEAVNDGTFQGAYTLTGNGVTFSAAGQVNQPPANNAGGYVSTALAINPSPSSMTVVISFAGTGGGLLQLSNGSLPASSSQNAILYLSNYGTAVWGIYNFGLQPIASSTQPGQVANGITGVNYGDGNPHTIVASVGAAGMKLYADGVKIASNPNTQANGVASYWTVGAANTTLWPASPGNISFNGTIYYAAVYQGTQLTDAQALAIAGYAPPTPNNIPLCTIFGNIASLAQNLGFDYANQNITFATNPGPQLPQGVGAQIIAPTTTTIQTDGSGNLPSGFQLPQGAHVMMTIGSGTVPSRQIPLSIPLQSSVELAGLVLAEVDPPQVVSNIIVQGPQMQGWTVLNPAPGQIGPATIVSPNSVPQTCGSACTVAPSNGPVQTVTMTANVAINLCGQLDGQVFYVDTVENAVGGWTPTFSTCAPFSLLWNQGNGTAQPSMASTAANAHQIWSFTVEGNTVIGSAITAGAVAGGTLDMNYFSIIHINQADFNQLNPPSSLTLTPTCSGTCATTYTYEVTCLGDFGETLPSASGTATNAASLSSTNFNTISWPATTGCHGGYNVYGRIGGSLGLLATVATTSYKDDGTATPGAAPPTSNSTGEACFNGATSGESCISGQAAAGTPAVFRLPTTTGSAGYVLSNDGSNNTYWSGVQTLTNGSTFTTDTNIPYYRFIVIGAGGGGGSNTTQGAGGGGAGGIMDCTCKGGGQVWNLTFGAGGAGGGAGTNTSGGNGSAITEIQATVSGVNSTCPAAPGAGGQSAGTGGAGATVTTAANSPGCFTRGGLAGGDGGNNSGATGGAGGIDFLARNGGAGGNTNLAGAAGANGEIIVIPLH